MDDIIIAFLGLVLGAILMYWLFSFFRKKETREQTDQQSILLLEKIKSVCKLISVEGEFAEIYTYENTKQHFMNLVTSKKKALIVINAKVHVGFDLKKVQMHSDTRNKKIILTNFPQPEIVSVEPELQFYDIKNSLFNSFSPGDLTTLNKEAKQHIREKIPESGLMDTARQEALEAILLIGNIVNMIGWELDYTDLEMTIEEKQFLE